MGVVELGLLTYDCKSTWSSGLWFHLGLSLKATLTNNLTHKLVQFCSYKWIGHGGLIRVDGLLHNNFCILKFCWCFNTNVHKMEQVMHS
jgi:hypothetical protein